MALHTLGWGTVVAAWLRLRSPVIGRVASGWGEVSDRLAHWRVVSGSRPMNCSISCQSASLSLAAAAWNCLASACIFCSWSVIAWMVAACWSAGLKATEVCGPLARVNAGAAEGPGACGLCLVEGSGLDGGLPSHPCPCLGDHLDPAWGRWGETAKV